MTHRLQQRIAHRDRLSLQADQSALQLRADVTRALDSGDQPLLQRAVDQHQAQLQQLAENLRIYQAELRAQADELAATHARAESEAARFATLFAELPVAVLLVTRDGRLADHNRRAEQLFELRAAYAGPRFVHRLVAGNDYQHRVWPALHDGSAGVVENLAFNTEGGRRFDGDLHLSPLPGTDLQPPCLACAVIDRSEQLATLHQLQRAHEALQVSQGLLDDTSRLARTGGFELLRAPRRWRASGALCRLLGLPEDPPPELADMLDLCSPDGRQQLQRALDAALAGGPPFELELSMRSPDGRALQVLALGRCEVLSDRVPRVVGVLQDVSERVLALAAREAAERASRAKSAFLSRVSHELRTPLNAVLGFTQLMRLEAEDGDLQVKPRRLELMESAARHLLEIVNEVLDIERVESGRVQLQTVVVPLGPLLADCLELMQGLADGAHVALHLQPDTGLSVRGDPLRLKEVLLNLLSNAVKYNRPQGRVDVALRLAGEQVQVTVADTGRGIAPEALPSLFQPFNRLGAEATGVQGSGMGLYVSRRFVELMGGHIDVHSRAGEGTTFTVALPRG